MGGTVDAGGHGSPPGSRGSPRRTLPAGVSAAADAGTVGISTAGDPGTDDVSSSGDAGVVGAEAESADSDGCTGCVSTGASGANPSRGPASVALATASVSSAPSPTAGALRAAGGQGSPPGVRGSPRRGVRGVDAIYSREDFFWASSALMSCGTTVNRSPTIPKSAISKMGASGFLSIATIVRAVCMPARC